MHLYVCVGANCELDARQGWQLPRADCLDLGHQIPAAGMYLLLLHDDMKRVKTVTRTSTGGRVRRCPLVRGAKKGVQAYGGRWCLTWKVEMHDLIAGIRNSRVYTPSFQHVTFDLNTFHSLIPEAAPVSQCESASRQGAHCCGCTLVSW